jgi:site-specific recombinase XerD
VRDVHLYLAWRMKKNVSPATLNRDLGVLRHVFEFAVEEGSLKMNPIARIRKFKEMRAERPRVSEESYLRIRKHLPFPVNLITTFIWETGCRAQ